MSVAGDIEKARYSRMRWNTPLSETHAGLLLDRLELAGGRSVLDLGCGWGELLIRAVDEGSDAGGPPVLGVGVDTEAGLLERGRARANECGVDAQIRFVEAGAEGWSEPADRVICVGSSHAWGGTQAALRGLGKLVKPGGRLLFGDGCWEAPPTDAARALFGEDVKPLAELTREAGAAGWVVIHMSTADQREWDEFESTWRSGREEWLLANPQDPRAAALRSELDARLSEYVDCYRGVLGFGYLILVPR